MADSIKLLKFKIAVMNNLNVFADSMKVLIAKADVRQADDLSDILNAVNNVKDLVIGYHDAE